MVTLQSCFVFKIGQGWGGDCVYYHIHIMRASHPSTYPVKHINFMQMQKKNPFWLWGPPLNGQRFAIIFHTLPLFSMHLYSNDVLCPSQFWKQNFIILHSSTSSASGHFTRWWVLSSWHQHNLQTGIHDMVRKVQVADPLSCHKVQHLWMWPNNSALVESTLLEHSSQTVRCHLSGGGCMQQIHRVHVHCSIHVYTSVQTAGPVYQQPL